LAAVPQVVPQVDVLVTRARVFLGSTLKELQALNQESRPRWGSSGSTSKMNRPAPKNAAGAKRRVRVHMVGGRTSW